MSNVNVIYNQEKHGVEVYFDTKPEASILTTLRANGFRWSNSRKMWYAKQSEATIGIARSLSGEVADSVAGKNIKKDFCLNLWELTRVDGIGSNVDKSLSCKEIAAKVRKHLRQRFPMCKFSVTSSYDRINVDIVAGPFAKDSEELAAIDGYASAYVNSFRYCVCDDPYSDYGSTYSFYGCYGSFIYWNYEQTEADQKIAEMCAEYQEKKEEFEIAERERMEREYAEQERKAKEARIEAEKRRKEREAKHSQVEANYVETPVDYFLTNVIDPRFSKLDGVSEYVECMADAGDDGEEEARKPLRQVCRVTREVRLDSAAYAIFSEQLLDDWCFVAGMGGSATADRRVGSMVDYNAMTPEERKTVEWFSNECVAVFCDDELKLVIDPQGYQCCRYTYFVDEETVRQDEYSPANKGMSDGYYEHCQNAAAALAEAGDEIISANHLEGVFDTERESEFDDKMREWIETNDFKLTTGAIRALDGAHDNLKKCLYHLWDQLHSVDQEFKRAGLKLGQRISVLRNNNIIVGRPSVTRGTLVDIRCSKIGDTGAVVLGIENGRRLVTVTISGDALVYDGLIDINDFPSDVEWDYEKIYCFMLNRARLPLVNTCKSILMQEV